MQLLIVVQIIGFFDVHKSFGTAVCPLALSMQGMNDNFTLRNNSSQSAIQ